MTFLEYVDLDPDDGAVPIVLLPHSDTLLFGDLDLGWPDPRDNIRDRANASGQIDRTSRHGARTVTAEITAFAPGTELTRLLASCHTSRRPTLRFRRPGQDMRRMLLAGRIGSAPHVGGRPYALDTVLTWRCPDGLVEDDTLSTRSAIPVQPPDGIVYPVTYPITYPGSSGGGLFTATNLGEVPAWPTIRFDGPLTDPTLHNDTTGDQVAMTYTLAAGDYIEIDTRNVTVRLNGDPDTAMYQHLVNPASSFWQLPVGTSNLRFTAAASAAPAKATVSWRAARLW